MDIELRLREILVLEDPGVRFTRGVMSRVGDALVGQAHDGVVRLSEARARKRSRRILLGTVVAISAAASIPAFFLSGRTDVPVVREAAAAFPGASPADPSLQMQTQVQSEPAGNGQDRLDCVDPDVLRGLLLQGSADQTFHISTDLPPELAAFKAPRQLSWSGAAERGLGRTSQGNTGQQSSVSAVYRTSLAPEAARLAAVGALTAGGWKQQPDVWNITSVFTSGNSSPTSETYCREGKPVGITASALDGVTYVVLSISRNPGSAAGLVNACDQSSQPFFQPASVLDKYMPKLELPRDPDTGQPASMRGGGNSNGIAKRRSDASFTLKDSVGNVASHFARQMAEQGWNADASWSGAGTAGSTWTRQPDAETVLRGTLTVSAFDEGRFTVVFSLVSAK